MRAQRFGLLGTAVIIGLAIVTAAGCSSGSGSKAAAAPTSTTIPGAGSGDYKGPTIVTQGTGEVRGTPDTVTLSLGVQTTAPTAVATLNGNNYSAAALIATLKHKGVQRKDIQTSNLSISPNYDLQGHITGYSASNSLTVTVHGIAGAGQVIDAAAHAVGNAITFNGVQLSIGDTNSRSLIAKARAAAVKQAIGHAQQLADAAGVKLGAVRTISDTGNQLPQPQFFSGSQAADLNKAAVPIEAGSQQLSVNVEVTFALQ